MNVHRPRKRFGQHFLRDPGVIDAILRAIAPQSDDVIVEIGPGRGAMTRALADRAASLHAIEIDRDLVAKLTDQFSAVAGVTIHEADALRFDYCALDFRCREGFDDPIFLEINSFPMFVRFDDAGENCIVNAILDFLCPR